MKKVILSALIFVCFLITKAQIYTQHINRCGTKVPSQQWDAMFNSMVTNYKVQKAASRTNNANSISSTATYTIPVIIHVIHGGEAVGTYPNLSQSQINSQITVLNQDYSGTGMGVNSYTALSSGGNGPFYDYAQANSLPSPDNTTNGIAVANTGITFVLATKDTNGNLLPEPGIDRINYTTYGWNNPTTYTTDASFETYLDGTVKPATVWNVTKYFNVWISDATGLDILEYAKLPVGTSLTGLPTLGMTGAGTPTTDGVWVYTYAFGSQAIEPSGTYATPYNYGRSLTHSTGHYLGLRHTWGDGTCATDYCNDTPPEQSANYSMSSWLYPCSTNTCSGTGNYNSDNADGIMYMNFMDFTPDAYVCMFTNDQTTRMQTAMSQSPNRNGLTASAINMGAVICTNTPTVSFSLVADATPHVWDVMPSVSGGITPYTYLWTWGDGSSTDTLYTSHTYTVAAHYAVCLQVTGANGCASQYCENDSLYRMSQSTTMIQINVVNNTLGITQLENQNEELKIFPNPVNQILNVAIQTLNKNTEVQITDMLGNLVKQSKIYNSQTKIDVSNFNSGIYFLRVGNSVQKFTKQ